MLLKVAAVLSVSATAMISGKEALGGKAWQANLDEIRADSRMMPGKRPLRINA
jgi:hypothetical protein